MIEFYWRYIVKYSLFFGYFLFLLSWQMNPTPFLRSMVYSGKSSQIKYACGVEILAMSSALFLDISYM